MYVNVTRARPDAMYNKHIVTVRNWTMEDNVVNNATNALSNTGGALYAANGFDSVTLEDLVMVNNSAVNRGLV